MAKHTALRRGALVLSCLVFAMMAASAPRNTKPFAKKPAPLKSDFELGFYGNTRQQFFATYKHVAMLPVELAPELGDRPDAQRGIEEAVTKYLKLANFDVVPSQRYVELAERHNRELGGIFNPRTGARREKIANEVAESSRRELEVAEHLDGFVRVRVTRMMAALEGATMRWDGVHEFSSGPPRKKGDDWKPVGMVADIAALSLHLEFFKIPDHAGYSSDGGLQPVAYARDIKDLGVTAVSPGSADLLQDPVRFDRAARAATLSLRYTPEDFAKSRDEPDVELASMDPESLPPLPEPRQNSAASPLLRPRDEILKSVHRVALAPLESAGLIVTQAVESRFQERIRAELAPLHWDLVDAPRANELLIHKIVASDLFDPFTGKQNEAGFSEARKSVFPSLGIKPVPDAILWVRVVHTVTMQREGDAFWDGVNQNAVTLGPVRNPGKVRKFWNWYNGNSPGAASIRAASLEVQLTDANDATLYSGRGGIQLLQKVEVSQYGTHTDDISSFDLFKDQLRIDQAVHLALRDLALTPEALAAEANGPVPVK